MSRRDSSARIQSIDTVRGLIMIIMALDHVREFFHNGAFSADPVDPATTTPILFFTRWITHYCAPSFLMLSGISAYLSGSKKSSSETSSFLFTRGLWLVFVEVIIVSFALTFDITYKVLILQVIWALGTSMIVLSLLIRFVPIKGILIIGLLLVVGHNLLDTIKLQPDSTADIVLNVFFTAVGKFYPVGVGKTIGILYVILPWTGLMLVGYGLGPMFNKAFDVAIRKKNLLIIGGVATTMFVILRLINAYGDPNPWRVQSEDWRTFLSFFNVTKYPPSLMYSLMTIGPVLILLSLVDRTENRVTQFLSVYGKVPFFYYILHFYLIHSVSALVVLGSGYTWAQATDSSLFFQFRPFDFGFSLGPVYLVWVGIVLVLYLPCRWFGRYKAKHKKKKWLSYL